MQRLAFFCFFAVKLKDMSTEDFVPRIEMTEVSALQTLKLENLPFGKYFTDHMLVADYANGAWQDVRITPYRPFEIHPSMSALHYGQSIFEGIKAFRTSDGGIAIFRPGENLKRFNRSAARMEMPEVPASLFLDGMQELIRLDQAWVPDFPEHSLYIRPFMFATDHYLGVRPSETYRFMIILSPSGPFFMEPQRIHVERKYVRAVEGGVGFAKTAGNYGSSMHAAAEARKQGYDQVLWTDPVHHRFVQEIGMMNVFFRIGDTVVTPGLDAGTILEGVTRDSLITLLKEWGRKVEERAVSMDELVEAYDAGNLLEVFGSGTAASVSMIRELGYEGRSLQFDPMQFFWARELRQGLLDIREGRVADNHGWLLRVV
jgi:branched-chain amino acid aminotransferase